MWSKSTVFCDHWWKQLILGWAVCTKCKELTQYRTVNFKATPPVQEKKEEEDFYDDSNSEQLKKENREDLVKMQIIINKKERPVK